MAREDVGARVRGLAAFLRRALRRARRGPVHPDRGCRPNQPGGPVERRELAERVAGWRAGMPSGAMLVDEVDPARFMASFAGAVSGEGNLFLANPSWRSRERAEFGRLVKAGAPQERGWLMIPSGGAGGELKFARHDAGTIASAVGGFCGHFGMGRVNSV